MTTQSPSYTPTEARPSEGLNDHAQAGESDTYPRSGIPWHPVLSLRSFKTSSGGHIPSILDAADVRFVTSGRIAIALALKQMKIGPGDKVLVPAYHCASMIEPVVWAGATPVFYKINRDTSIDLDDIHRRIDASTKLLMAAHYFGFPQNLQNIRSFCDTHAILLLEDCAHSFFGERDGRTVGSVGDYAIASSMKFFPVYDGGCLISSRHKIESLSLRSGGIGFQLKSTFNTLEKGFEYGRLPLLRRALDFPLRLKDLLWNSLKRRSSANTVSLGPGASDGGFGFETKWLDKKSSFVSRLMIKLVSKPGLAAKRRKNYLALHDALSALPGCSPLFPKLPDGVYPWVYPLVTDYPEKVFPALKTAGVPVVRFGEFLWPGVDSTICETSVDLSERVMQFPCHQELTEKELDFIIEKTKAAISGST